jgi:micrococcal nuclease
VLLFQYGREKGYIEGSLARNQTVFIHKTESQTKEKDTYSGEYTVSRVVDGDTIDIENSQGTIRVRLIGVNTPESVAPNRPDECYGKEASEYVARAILRSTVTLELDTDKPLQDKYGRLLAYVRKSDGTLLNKEIIEKGYGYEYTYQGEKYIYSQEFKKAESFARENALGLWSEGTCNGKK